MTVVVALLRGVNVGGNNLIGMEALRTLCGSLGLCDSRTYLQSGNVVFRTELRGNAALAKRMEDAIEREFGFRPSVMLRTLPEMRSVIARNPFAALAAEAPSRFLVNFLAREPEARARDDVNAMNFGAERLRIEGREVYTYFPNGIGRSTLQLALIEKRLKVPGTSRNWNTVTKLVEIAAGLTAAAVGSRASKLE